MLNAVFVGMVALETSLRGTERMARDLDGCRRQLGIGRRVPDATLARMLTMLRDEQGLRQALIGQIRGADRRKALEPVLPINMVAIDGQTLWCSDKPIDDPACQKMTQDDGTTYYRIHALHAVLVSAASQPCIASTNNWYSARPARWASTRISSMASWPRTAGLMIVSSCSPRMPV